MRASLAALLVACSGAAHAGQEVARIPFFDTPEGTAALGGGIRLGQSLYRAFDSDEQRQTDLIPLYLYNGKYLFARGTSGGLHLLNRESLEFNALARYRFQKLDPDRNAYYEGLEERDQTVDAGFEVILRQDWGTFTADWMTDVLDRHNGEEIGLSYRYDIDLGPWTISPFIAWSRQDADLTNYYYGVSAAEARTDRPEYAPGESQWVTFGMNSAWRITDRIELFANVGFGGVDSVVRQSPLVAEDSGSAVFLGGTYVFGSTRRPEPYVSPERSSEWSWRVNYGYQAQGNIVGEVNHGDFGKSKVADTTIGGLTLSKLIADGPRVEFYGRFAAFRHFEEDEGNGNFFSYAAYIMAMGKGYSPWTDEELFRWGFGFGMSYADRVPIVEQRKQAKKGGNTSHFLNYLEMTVDFPLARMFEARSVRNCYAGLTIVHRSGIFGTSDFLGDVAGGSDWLTAHVECLRR
jgi:outer membrane scaffolding protein for murein synthesis (MipA/OmpV family)